MNHTQSPESESTFYKPRLGRLLAALRLDVEYSRGDGAVLFSDAAPSCDGGWQPAEVLDFVGGFGALLLGHSPPPLVAHMRELLDAGLPMQTQGARSRPAELLARRLVERSGDAYVCVFGNSGAEAVEAALKHALLETGGRTFITVERGFHGKTLGALQTIGNPQYLSPFSLDGLSARRVEANDVEQLCDAFREIAATGRLAGMIVEPILGEGGVRPLSREFLQSAKRNCDEHRVPLIVDECQTGCGRTGTWLACESAGIRPDYLVLSKSLGGGLTKIAATLIDRRRYCEEFDWKHTSTFAADNHSCSIALRAVELIDDELLLRVRQRGALLRDGLRAIRAEFPDVIADVRGEGLMLGVEFVPPRESTSFVFRVLTSQDELLFLVAGYLLARHRVRVLPTLSDPWTLRLQPPACVTEQQCARLLNGLRDVCGILRDGQL
ncbi:MAG TPA: aspartate aminotransferase family protein, partial [Pirellulaceae bacterium]|nr:aspartate aminotransferase family protein [Pirellulaceae bacterium]